MVASGRVALRLIAVLIRTSRAPTTKPIIIPPIETNIKRPSPSQILKCPLSKTDNPKLSKTNPVASLNKDSNSTASLTPSGIFFPEIIDFTATASVGVTIAAKQIAKGKIQLPIILFVSTATKSTVTTAKVIDRKNIPLKFFRTFFNEVLLPS